MKKQLINLCDRLVEYFDWENESPEIKTITKIDKLKEKVYKARENASNYGFGITILYSSIASDGGYSSSFSDYVYAKRPSDFTQERVYHLTTYINIINEIVELYELWNSSELFEITNSLQNHQMFGNDRIQIDPQIVEGVRDLIAKGVFQSWFYRNQPIHCDIEENMEYHINSKVYLSQDIDDTIEGIESQREFIERDKTQFFITLFSKIKPVHLKGSPWMLLILDQNSNWRMVTVNEDINTTPSQSIWSEGVDSKFHQIDLPYIAFTDSDIKFRYKSIRFPKERTKRVSYLKLVKDYFRLDERLSEDIISSEISILFRKDLEEYYKYKNCTISVEYLDDQLSECRAFAKIDGRVIGYYESAINRIFIYTKGVMVFDIKELTSGQKILITMLCNNLYKIVSNPKGLLLTHQTILMDRIEKQSTFDFKNCMLEGWSEEVDRIFTESLYNLASLKRWLLNGGNYQKVYISSDYDAYKLGMEPQIEKELEWIDLRQRIKPAILNIEFKRFYSDNGFVELLELIKHNESVFLDNVYGGDDLTITPIEDDSLLLSARSLIDNGTVDMRRGYGIGKYQSSNVKVNEHISCSCCKESEARKVREITIHHYKALMFLLKIEDRDELPKYYRNYRSVNHIPYKGGFASKDNHPYIELIEKDPCSLKHLNGIVLEIFLCGKCHNNYRKGKIKQLNMKI